MRVAIVEDNPILLETLKLLLREEPGITLADAFANAEETLRGLKKNPPDIIIVDLGLPDMSGIELIKKIKENKPDVQILVHTISDDKENVFSSIKAGASGYILKGNSPREIIKHIQNIHAGGAPMSPKIARKVISEFHADVKNEEYILSHREKEMLAEIEKGLSYNEIADKLNISPHTVHTHIKNIYEKLHAKTRQEALMTARRKGII